MERERVVGLAREYGLLALVGLIGVGILSYGLWQAVVPEKAVVEIVKGDNESEVQTIYVDVGGAVEKPGVYKLQRGARIGDALVAAEGLSAGADRLWVSRSLNLAEQVKDGQKIYIPEKNESQSSIKTGSQTDGKVNINSAEQSELERLNGIGETRAKAIIASRPYSSVEELISKAKIPQSVYEKIKDQITIY